jgi:hypothetical protein
MEELKIGLSALAWITAGEKLSKVIGRKNYVIYIVDSRQGSKYAVAMSRGEAEKRGALGASLSSIAAQGKTWINFTYKKDWLAMVDALGQDSYEMRLL